MHISLFYVHRFVNSTICADILKDLSVSLKDFYPLKIFAPCSIWVGMRYYILGHAYFNNPGGPETEVFLELGLE